jgi:putative Mn2+ efflux pump MntP
MNIFELLLLAVGLSMDAFAVSITKGLSIGKICIKDCLIVGMYFGLFQAFMPLIGYYLSSNFAVYITSYDHWIAFILLAIIGINMIRESREKETTDKNASISFKAMLPLAIATSIDALAVGVSFAFLNINIYLSVIIIGITTFIISAIGVKIGSIFGTKYKAKAELCGGIILILIGLKVLFEHLGLINF